MSTYKQAVCGILIEDGKILSVSRKDDHSQLGLPGGKVDEGETPEQAIIRECLEETGIFVEITSENTFESMDGDYHVTCYLLERESEENIDFIVDENETGKVEFVDINKLLSAGPFIEYNKKALKYFGINYVI